MNILAAGLLGTGVVSGCAVTGSGVDTVAVSAGDVRINTNVVEVAAQNVTIADGHATLPRHDLITIDEAGTAAVVAGTPTAEPNTPLPDIPASRVVVASVWVPAASSAVAANQVTDLRALVLGSPIYDGDQIQRATLGEMGIYGHSYAEGVGASDGGAAAKGTAGAERGVAARLCAMFGMRARSFAKGGAILARHNQNTTGDGGYQTLLQGEQRTARAGTTLNGAVTAGANTITVTSATGFSLGQAIHVGSGDTGAAGGEIRYVAAVAGAVLTLDDELERNHANLDPVYEVPSAFLAWRSIYLLWWGLHDLAYSPISSSVAKYRSRYDDALEMVIARCLAAEFYENEHSSSVPTGTFTTDPTAGVYSGATGYVFNAVNALITIHVMDNFNGEPITLWFAATHNAPATAEPVLTFRVDGVSIGTKTIYQNYQEGGATWRRGFCKRITGLAPGRHKIEAEVTTFDSSLKVAYDGWSVEATIPSLVLVPGFTRMLDDYSYYNGLNTSNQPRTTTLTGTHGIGTTSWTVASTSGWQVGTTVTFEPGGANEESLEVLTVPSGTTFTTAASTISHAGGVSVRTGIQDYDVEVMNTRQQTIVDTFGESVVWVDADAALNRNPEYFGYDHDHPNDLGYQVLGDLFYNAAMSAPTVKPTLALTTSVPASPSELEYVFIGGTIIWTNQPSGEQEFRNEVGARRKKRSLRRFSEVKFEVGVNGAGATGAILYPKYSLDGGTTWKKLDRTAQGLEGTGHHVSITAVGFFESSFLALPEEARTSGVLLALFGSGGDGAADPAIAYAALIFR